MPRRSRFRMTAVFALSIAMLAATQVILGQSRVAITVDVGKTLATCLHEPRISAGMLWTTRWMDWKSADSVFYALDRNNGLQPQGRAVALWGEFLQERMIEVGNAPGLVTFATASASGDVVSVFLMNKSSQSQSTDLSLIGAPDYVPGEVFRFQGKSDTDTKPKWARMETVVPQANVIEGVNLPALSITVISLHALQL